MTTMIPPTEFTQIIQTNSSPETIVALLNEAERSYFQPLRSWRKKTDRVYPFWKTCKHCSRPFPCGTKDRVNKTLTCSKLCSVAGIRAANMGRTKPIEERAIVTAACAMCGTPTQRPRSHAARTKEVFCSTKCNGMRRIVTLLPHSGKGRAAWSDAAVASHKAKMTGANNHAWKGGVTLRNRHGNHVGAKYVRCPTEFLSMARKDGYVMEHRLEVARVIGRCLTRTEAVHHMNHDSTDNRVTNLALFKTNKDHKLFEHHGSPAPIWCGSAPSTIAE